MDRNQSEGNRTQSKQIEVRSQVREVPKGWQMFKYIGPGFLWALSSAGAGEIFYSPRVGARYGFSLMWAALIVMFFAFMITREIGRYTVVSGKTFAEGYCDLPGPRKWAVWFFLIAQIGDLSLTTAGHAALTATLFLLVLPGTQFLYAAGFLILGGAIIVFGGYNKVSKYSSLHGAVLLGMAVYAVMQVFPPVGKVASGFVPSFPKNLDIYFLLPWIGFLIIHGAPWFSYWVGEQGFAGGFEGPLHKVSQEKKKGGSKKESKQKPTTGSANSDERQAQGVASKDSHSNSNSGNREDDTQKTKRIKGWIRLMSWTGGLGTAIAGLLAFIFYILGVQLIGGQQQIPQGFGLGKDLADQVAKQIGQITYYLFIFTAAGTFWTTVFDTQDGASRLLADSTVILTPGKEKEGSPGGSGIKNWILEHLNDHKWMLKAYVIGVGSVLPILILLLFGNPSRILAFAGILSAAETPMFTVLTLWLNKNRLPQQFQPSWWTITIVVLAGLFYAVISTLVILHLFGINLLGGLTGGSSGGS